jgi:hypothetical protein
MFSLKELLNIQKFLETWNLNTIYKILDEKYKEYLWIIEEIKNIKLKKRVTKQKNIEQKERKNEEFNLELLMNF